MKAIEYRNGLLMSTEWMFNKLARKVHQQPTKFMLSL